MNEPNPNRPHQSEISDLYSKVNGLDVRYGRQEAKIDGLITAFSEYRESNRANVGFGRYVIFWATGVLVTVAGLSGSLINNKFHSSEKLMLAKHESLRDVLSERKEWLRRELDVYRNHVQNGHPYGGLAQQRLLEKQVDNITEQLNNLGEAGRVGPNR